MYNNNIDGDVGVNEGDGNGLDHVEDLLELALIWRVSPTVANFISRHTYTHFKFNHLIMVFMGKK